MPSLILKLVIPDLHPSIKILHSSAQPRIGGHSNELYPRTRLPWIVA
jgi:hypothetical protein